MNKNILFVLCDQLRWDYLSCYGHPTLETPNIDWLAKNGVRFDRAYCQAPVCGPSRACISTGRYMSSQGAMWNTDPTSIGEKMMGEYLRPLGLKTAVIGKTDHRPDVATMKRLGIDPNSEIGRGIAHRDMDPYDLDNGIHPHGIFRPGSPPYNQYLQAQEYPGDNPWLDYAVSVVDDDGKVRDGWIWSNSKYPSRIPEEHSESAYVTNRAIQFMTEVGTERWCLQLGYYKPHWPYVAPAPYHNLYCGDDMLPANRTSAECQNAHPVLDAFRQLRLSQVWSNETARETIIPTYMGLVKQVDDQFGRLLTFMRAQGLLEETLIVFTSDHGDNLGDHWCGEKDLPYECSMRVPFLIYNPSTSADATRGTVENRFVEQIDLLPTFIETAGGDWTEHTHRLEGRSLHPLLRNDSDISWRAYAISELDFNGRDIWREHMLDIPYQDARGYVIRTEQWKYVLHERFRPQLYDMLNDPQEQNDLGEVPDYETVRQELHETLFHWLRNLKRRITVTPEEAHQRYGSEYEDGIGILIGWWE
ncbi:MAG: sulfatase-like hydrolase/transferase [Chloroflexota bacterium]